MQVNVLEYLERGAAPHCPNETAVIDGERCFSFREVERYAKACATLLIERAGVISRQKVVYQPKSIERIRGSGCRFCLRHVLQVEATGYPCSRAEGRSDRAVVGTSIVFRLPS